MISVNNVMGIIRRWKNSIISLRLRFLEIPHKKIWVSWRVPFHGLGVQKGTQTPCWLKDHDYYYYYYYMYRLHYWETCTLTCAERDFWAICHSQLVQVDRLVSYRLVFNHLRFGVEHRSFMYITAATDDNCFYGNVVHFLLTAYKPILLPGWTTSEA